MKQEVLVKHYMYVHVGKKVILSTSSVTLIFESESLV